MNGTLFSEANDTISVDYLDFFVCNCVDFPRSGIDCSLRQPNRCFKCKFAITYLSGESINDFRSIGHIICRILAFSAILVSLVGIVTNWLIFMIVRSKGGKRSFDFLICALSHVDNLCCLTCIIYCGSHLAYYDNLYGRGKATLYWLNISSLTMLLMRAISMYLTMVITTDRYLAIAYPLQSKTWYSLGKTKLQTALIIIFVSLVVSPAYISVHVGPNIYGSQEGGLDVPSLRDFEYMFTPTRFHSLTQRNHTVVTFIYLFQYWIPVPALLILNFLTYKNVEIMKKRRHELTCSQQKELQPAHMFIPVVIVFLLTNIWPLIILVTLRVWNINFREMWMSFTLATSVNSSINFWIYYLRGKSFRIKAKYFFTTWSFSRSRSSRRSENY